MRCRCRCRCRYAPGPHVGPLVETWLDGLLPDRAVEREEWRRRVGAVSASPFGLLSTPIGGECAGAVQFEGTIAGARRQLGEQPSRRSALEPVSETDLGAVLAEMSEGALLGRVARRSARQLQPRRHHAEACGAARQGAMVQSDRRRAHHAHPQALAAPVPRPGGRRAPRTLDCAAAGNRGGAHPRCSHRGHRDASGGALRPLPALPRRRHCAHSSRRPLPSTRASAGESDSSETAVRDRAMSLDSWRCTAATAAPIFDPGSGGWCTAG